MNSEYSETVQDISEEIKKREKLAGVHVVSNPVELIANGEYCPNFTVSTNDTTEYVTITFTPLRGNAFSILITKHEFFKFSTQLNAFLTTFMCDGGNKQLIKG